ncbi:MAG: hypothetical protein EP332_09200 [Bacteroidetes bacterium]|nr:MAG: hypothetical protein EP332_09200 [Bacteroidota bacterium]
MRRSLLFILLALTFHACSKEEAGLPSGDYFIFGYFYDCPAETCVEYFKMEGDKLFEDSKDEYPLFGLEPELEFKESTKTKWEMVNDLPDLIPSQLWESKEKVFGKPDFYNQGGLYVRVKQGNKEAYWFLDKDPSHVEETFRGFVQVLNSRLAMISD